MYEVFSQYIYFFHFQNVVKMKIFSAELCIELSALPVEGEHGAGDGHVHWHLSGHPANHKHLLPGVGVEGGVVDVLGSPELILCQARLHHPGSEKVNTEYYLVFST